jgi:NADPH:quinone reductase
MRAALCTAFDGPKALVVDKVAAPVPAADEVLVEVHAAAVSFMDWLMASGGYQMRPPLPYVPGTDGAGVILAVGDAVEGLRPGDRVACSAWLGAFAERMTGKAAHVTRLPDAIDFMVGSVLRYAYLTAYYALIERARTQTAETVLVTGAAGGVGLACIEIARQLDARVFAVVGSPAKVAAVREAGADAVIDASSEDVRERVKALTGGSGVDVCVDNVGGKLFQTLARVMAWNGRLLPVGFTSGEIPSIPMNLPLLKNYSIVGLFMGVWSDRYPAEAARAMQVIVSWVAEGKIRPRIDRVLPLERAAEAMEAIASRSVAGRIVLSMR